MKNFTSKWWIVGLGLVALTLCLLLTPSLWQKLDGWVQNQRDLVWQKLENAVGQKVSYDRIAPNILAALDFRNVRILADDGTSVVTAASIRFSWDWPLVFEGRFAEALRTVRFINLSTHFDSRRDAVLLKRWETLADNTTKVGVPALDFQIEAFNLSLHWTDGVHSLALDRAFLTLNPKNDEWRLRFRGALSAEDRSSGRNYVSMEVKGDLRSDAAFEKFSLKSEVSQVSTSWFDLEPLTLQITVDPRQALISKVADQNPVDFQARLDRTTGSWNITGEAEDFRPSKLIHEKGNSVWTSLAEATVHGRFQYRIGGEAAFEGRLSWPAGILPAPWGSEGLSAQGSVKTEGPVLQFKEVHLQSQDLAINFDGTLDSRNWLPDGELYLERWNIPGLGEGRGTFELVRLANRVEFHGGELNWNSLSLLQPAGWLEKTSEGWSMRLDGQLDGTDRGVLSAQGTLTAKTLAWDLGAKVTALPLHEVFRELQRYQPNLVVPSALGPLEVGLTTHLAGLGLALESADSGFELEDPDRIERRAVGTVNWKVRHLDVSVSDLRWGGFNGSAVFAAEFRDTTQVDWTMKGKLWDRFFALKGRWDPFESAVFFSGSPGLQGQLRQDPSGTWIAGFSMLPLEVVPGWTLGFQGEGFLKDDNWGLEADRVTLSGHYPWNKEAFFVQARVTADPKNLKLLDLRLKDNQGLIVGGGESSWSSNYSHPWVGQMTMSTPQSGRESFALNWTGSAPDHWHVVLKTSGADLTRGGVRGLRGRLNLDATLDWSGEERHWSAQAALSEAQYGDSPLGFRATLSGTSTQVAVRSLNLLANPIRISDGSVDINTKSRTWLASLGFGFRFGTNDWESRWASTGTWSPSGVPWKEDFRLQTRGNTWAKQTLPDWAVGGSWGESGWKVVLDEGGLSAQGRSDGSFQVNAQAPFPIRGDAAGDWTAGGINVAVKGFRVDLALFKGFLHTKLFSVLAGQASGDFSLSGAPSDPDVNGRLLLSGLTVESSFVRRPLGPVDVPVIFEGHFVRIDSVNVGPPGQIWNVAGLAKLDHLFPEEFQFSVTTDAFSMVPASYQYNGISAIGGVNGTLLVKGNPQGVTLGGRLQLEDTTITLKDSEPSPDASSLDINADIVLVTGRRVEFVWPNKAFPLIQSVSTPGQVMMVKANQVASTWSLNGKLTLKTGEINYLNHSFILREGVLVFQEDQSRFDPQVSLRGEWRVQEDTGPVLVILRADGSLAKFSPRFESSPYLSPAILQQLVGTSLGIPSDNMTAKNADAAWSLASDMGTGFLLTPLEEAVKRNLNLDLFTVQTQLLKRTLLNRNDSTNAVDYLDNSRLFFGKYIGDDLFLQGTLAFYEGVIDATQVSQVVEVDPEIEMDLETPFFMLNWTLLLQHPNTYFVSDNSVTLRWHWSY